MFALKKTITTALACAMITGMSLVPSQALTKEEWVEGEEYQLVSKEYALHNLDTIYNSANEMGFFHSAFAPKAEVLVDGDTETFRLTLYVANDVDTGYSVLPLSSNYTVERDLTEGVWTDAYLTYGNNKYYATTVPGLYNPAAPQVTFTKNTSDLSGWGAFAGVNIQAGRSYTCDVVTFSNIPVTALDGALLEGAWGCNGKFTNSSTLTGGYEFYDFSITLDLDYELVPSEEEPPEEEPQAPSLPVDPIVEEKQVTLSATKSAVTAPAPDYSITIPETVDVPNLIAGEDATISYGVTVNLGTATSVTVSSCTEGVLTTSAGDQLPFTNRFTTETCQVGGLKYGELTISKDDIAQAAPGDYTGNIQFAFRFVA